MLVLVYRQQRSIEIYTPCTSYTIDASLISAQLSSLVVVCSETSISGPSEKQTTSVQWYLEIVYLEPPRRGHLSTLDSGQPACPQRTVVCTRLPPRADRHRNHKQQYEQSFDIYCSDSLSAPL